MSDKVGELGPDSWRMLTMKLGRIESYMRLFLFKKASGAMGFITTP